MIEEATIPKACQQLAKYHFRQHYRRAPAPGSSKGIENIHQPACFPFMTPRAPFAKPIQYPRQITHNTTPRHNAVGHITMWKDDRD